MYEGVSGVMIGSPDAVKLVAEPPGKSESLRKTCRRLSRQIFEKYLNFLRPLCRRIQRVGNYGNNNGKLGGKKLLFHGGKYTTTTTTREAHHQCIDEWRRSSCDSETSIYDAVLHCKNSIGLSVSLSLSHFNFIFLINISPNILKVVDINLLIYHNYIFLGFLTVGSDEIVESKTKVKIFTVT